MTKKDFELIAEVIKREYMRLNTNDSRYSIKSIAHNMAEQLADENPLFNREKFLTACGVTE